MPVLMQEVLRVPVLEQVLVIAPSWAAAAAPSWVAVPSSSAAAVASSFAVASTSVASSIPFVDPSQALRVEPLSYRALQHTRQIILSSLL